MPQPAHSEKQRLADSLAAERAEKQRLADSLSQEQSTHGAAKQQLREQAEQDRAAARAWLDNVNNLRQLPLLVQLAETDISNWSRSEAQAALLSGFNVLILQRPNPGPPITEPPCGKGDINKAVAAVHPDKARQAGAPPFVVELFTRASATVIVASKRVQGGGD